MSALSSVAPASADVTGTVTSGPFLFAAGLAVLAGLISFASPCTVPLVPGYLSYLAGLVGAEEVGTRSGSRIATLNRAAVRSKAVVATAFFVAGFTLVFLLESIAVFGLIDLTKQVAASSWLPRIGGVVTIVMGLVLLGWIAPLQADRRLPVRPRGRLLGAPLLGVVFGFGWTACYGPTLVGVQSLGLAQHWDGQAFRGLFLVLLYCAGLGIPFLILAWGLRWATAALGFLRRHARAIQIGGGLLLIAVGLAMVTGLWQMLLVWLQGRVAGIGSPL